MPQLDKFSFATQLFWFCFLFLAYYLLIINKFLPNVLKMVRLRAYHLTHLSAGVSLAVSEELLIQHSFIGLSVINMQFIQTFSGQLQKVYNNWLQLQQYTVVI